MAGLFGVGYAVLFATARTAIPPYVAAFLGLFLVATWQLRRRDQWLVTFTTDERERIPGRQAAMAAVARRPAFRVLVVAVLVAVAIANLAAAVAVR
jgi:hypothetical protein